MTKHEAIKIIKAESVQKFPTKITCHDFAEAKKIVLELAEKQIEHEEWEVRLP